MTKTATKKAPAKANSGRPAGSKTKSRPIVDCTPTPCPHCKAIAKPTNLHNKRTVIGRGRVDGKNFGTVTMRNGNCGACGKPIMVREYEFVE